MRTWMVGAAAVACALAASGCDGTTVVSSPDSPSASGVTATIRGPAPFVVYMNTTILPVQRCDLILVAAAPVDVQHVTMHLIDGSNLGGPMITVPGTTLASQFGSVHLQAGTTRTFPLTLPLASPLPARSLGAHVGVLDVHGITHTVAAVGACP